MDKIEENVTEEVNISTKATDFNKSAIGEEEKQVHQHAQSLTKKEYYSLKEHKYEAATRKYKTAYTIMNKKTGLIVEMKAASPLHACTMIGWRPKNCKLIKTTISE